MRIVYAQLRGGLGNQLFQYSTARAIALAQNATLVLDPLTGFARDHVYRRKYELHALPINAKLVSFGLTSLFLLNQLIVKSKSKTLLSLSNKYLGLRVEENDFRYDDRLPKVPIKKRLWLVGYWQTPKYFEHLCDSAIQTRKADLEIFCLLYTQSEILGFTGSAGGHGFCYR